MFYSAISDDCDAQFTPKVKDRSSFRRTRETEIFKMHKNNKRWFYNNDSLRQIMLCLAGGGGVSVVRYGKIINRADSCLFILFLAFRLSGKIKLWSSFEAVKSRREDHESDMNHLFLEILMDFLIASVERMETIYFRKMLMLPRQLQSSSFYLRHITRRA